MVSKEAILGRLARVMDPELGINIVDLGLIYGIEVRKKQPKKPQKIFIRMTFTTPACPMMNLMLEQVRQELDKVPDADIELTVVFDTPWTPDRLSRKARIKLGIL